MHASVCRVVVVVDRKREGRCPGRTMGWVHGSKTDDVLEEASIRACVAIPSDSQPQSALDSAQAEQKPCFDDWPCSHGLDEGRLFMANRRLKPFFFRWYVNNRCNFITQALLPVCPSDFLPQDRHRSSGSTYLDT